ncbi:MAG TPA: GNAT family N-acetyltransferase [Allosphingosinicella sp.]|nr:GNAT family N-acetyltransferase [Allosphingosinicella sp.]
MRLRVTTPVDCEAVSAVLGPSYAVLMAAAYPPDLLARTLPVITKANPALLSSGRYYLVEAETGEPAGCGGWSPNPPGRRDGDPERAHVRHFATHPDWTRRGVGRLLYERCEADARAAGFTVFEAWSSLNGEGFYASLGFRRLGPIETPMPGGAMFPAVRMERPI